MYNYSKEKKKYLAALLEFVMNEFKCLLSKTNERINKDTIAWIAFNPPHRSVPDCIK